MGVMHAEQVIESYVADVVRRLPRRQCGDVAVELRELLREELAGGGGDSDEAGAMALVHRFGPPAEVAARYRPTFTIIEPVDSRAFLKSSLVGVGLIWLVGLTVVFQHAPPSISDGLLALRDFYTRFGLQTLMWPGFLVVWFGLAG
jgi:hypothetical protein